MKPLFRNIDCIELYVSNLDDGMRYYCESMGLKRLWKTETMTGLGMEEGVTEVVLQTERKEMSVDFLVNSVPEAIENILNAGGIVIHGPFEIPIGKCAVVKDRWKNEYVILDMTKGKYVTDGYGNVTGVN